MSCPVSVFVSRNVLGRTAFAREPDSSGGLLSDGDIPCAEGIHGHRDGVETARLLLSHEDLDERRSLVETDLIETDVGCDQHDRRVARHAPRDVVDGELGLRQGLSVPRLAGVDRDVEA
jgi:hypothetical protein